ncbi:hypothetical protein VUR80DRAFT_8032 [Thermomyces stellatus]
MCAGRVIADSDDSDDASPVPSPVRAGAPSSAGGNVPGSSDPGFFRPQFLAQQEAAIYDPCSAAEPSSGRPPNGEGSATLGVDGTDTYDPWAIMSSPDLLRHTAQSKTATRPGVSKTYSKKEDLSSSATSPKDATGVARSEAKHATPSKLSKTYSKKNPDANGSISSRNEIIDLVSTDQRSTTRPTSKKSKRDVSDGDSGAGDAAPRLAKRKKRISDLQVRDAGDLEEGGVDIPSSLDVPPTDSMASPTRRSGHDGPNGNSGQVYVEASKLTSSQKGQYEGVSLPSLSSFDEPPDLRQCTHLARSSGSATIAYPTPTQYRHPDPDPPSMPPRSQDLSPGQSRGSSKRRRMSSVPPTAENPRSSPDVISAAPDTDEIQSEADAEPPIAEPDNSCDEDWNEVDHGFPRAQERQPSRRQKRQRSPTQESTEIRDDATSTAGYRYEAGAQAKADHAPAPKKRGRKKVPDPEPLSPALEGTQPTGHAAPPKRKRGRPRKSDKVDAVGAVSANGPEPVEADHSSGTLHNTEGGSEEASCRDTEAKESDEQDNREAAEVDAKEGGRDVVSPKSGIPADTGKGSVETSAASPTNVSAAEGGIVDGKREPATEVQTGAPGKIGGLQKPGSKPVYRVGLSKRTKITPLLKCIRRT